MALETQLLMQSVLNRLEEASDIDEARSSIKDICPKEWVAVAEKHGEKYRIKKGISTKKQGNNTK